mgnify:CR=1 FL=1
MSPAKKITQHFGGDWHGSYGTFPAPGHSKSDRGMSVRDAENGDVLINSFNGGDSMAVKDECRGLGLIPEFRPSGEAWSVTGIYEFVVEDGTVVYRTVRKEKPGEKKRFITQRPNGQGGWTSKLENVQRVPYRLPELLAANPADIIYFVEGERKADKLASMGFTATAIAFGCKGWRAEYASHFAGRSVAILPDNDDEGRRFAETVKKAVEGVGGKPVIVELPGLPSKGDIIDWAGTADELRDMVSNAFKPAAKLFPLLDPATWQAQQTPLREWAWTEYIPHRQATYLTGPGSAGKSLLAQQLCTCIALGLPFIGVETRQSVVIYVTCEDDADELHRRQKAICEALGVPLTALSAKLHLVSLAGVPGSELVTFTPEGRMIVSEAYRVLLDTAKAVGARFVGLDNVAHLFAGNENIRNQVASFVSLLNGLALTIDGSVLFLGHPNKAGQEFSGSTAWENQVRSRLFMEVPKYEDGTIPDPDVRTLLRGKANYARNGERLIFRWHRWAFVREEELPKDQRAEIAATIAANRDNDIFLACLAERNRQQRPVSERVSKTYAPKVFDDMPESRRIGKARLEQAMDRLFRIGRIERGFLFRDTAEGKDKFGLREVSLGGCHGSANASDNVPPTLSANVRQSAENDRQHTPLDTTYLSGAAQDAAAPSYEEGPTRPSWMDEPDPAADFG